MYILARTIAAGERRRKKRGKGETKTSDRKSEEKERVELARVHRLLDALWTYVCTCKIELTTRSCFVLEILPAPLADFVLSNKVFNGFREFSGTEKLFALGIRTWIPD